MSSCNIKCLFVLVSLGSAAQWLLSIDMPVKPTLSNSPELRHYDELRLQAVFSIVIMRESIIEVSLSVLVQIMEINHFVILVFWS